MSTKHQPCTPETPLTIADLLSILEINPTDRKELSFAPKAPIQLKRYIEKLGTFSPSSQAQRLYTAVKEVSTLQEIPGQRMKLLGLLHNPIIQSAHGLAERTSLSHDANKVISLALALLRHLYGGYKQVIVATGREDTIHKVLLTNSISAAMSVINELFFCYWRHHLSPPTSLWKEMHTLFRIACALKLENQPVSFVSTRGKPEVTIHNSYLQALLTDSTCPPRYNAGELRHIVQFIARWSHLAELGTYLQYELFVVDTAGAQGPVYRNRVKLIDDEYLSLCPQKLVDALRDHCVKTDTDIEYVTIPDRIAFDLCQYWSQENLRQETDRKEVQTKPRDRVDLVVGIDNIHRMLAGTEFGEEFFTSLEQKIEPDSDPHASTAGHWRYPSFRCEYIDKSDSGFCIEADCLREALSPGEIVVLIDPDSLSQHSGVIRWVHNTSEMKTRVGIEQLKGELKPCAVCITRNALPLSPYLPAFTISSSKEDSRLLAPSVPLKVKNQIHLIENQKEGYFLLTDKVDMTFHVSHFKMVSRPVQNIAS